MFLADTCPFLGSLVPLFWISSPLGFKARVGSALFAFCGGECNVHSLRSTSGATLADLLAAGAQLVLSPHTVSEVRLPGGHLFVTTFYRPGEARYQLYNMQMH